MLFYLFSTHGAWLFAIPLPIINKSPLSIKYIQVVDSHVLLTLISNANCLVFVKFSKLKTQPTLHTKGIHPFPPSDTNPTLSPLYFTSKKNNTILQIFKIAEKIENTK